MWCDLKYESVPDTEWKEELFCVIVRIGNVWSEWVLFSLEDCFVSCLDNFLTAGIVRTLFRWLIDYGGT